MTAKSKNDLLTAINDNLTPVSPDTISAAEVRSVLGDFNDSTLNNTETSTQTVAGEVNFAGGLQVGGSDVSTFVDTRGWEYYQHSTTGQVINTTAALLQINGSGSLSDNTTKPPSDKFDDLWDTTGYKIQPIAVGDGYDVRIDIPITAKTGSPNAIICQLDIGAAATPTIVILNPHESITLAVPYTVSFAIPFVILNSTVQTNGIQLFVSTDTGTITCGAPAILIKRDM